MASLALSGCGTTSGLLPPDDLYPPAITACAPEPAVPARPAPDKPRPDAVKGQYIIDLRAAGADCRDTVAATADRKGRYQQQYDAAKGSPLDHLLHRHAK